MTAWTTPPTFDVGQLITAANLNSYLRDNPTYLYNHIPARAIMWHDEALVLSGGAITRSLEVNQQYNIVSNQASPANGDSFTNACFIKEGTYTFTVLGQKKGDAGKIDWYLDDSVTPFITGQD